jgi:hypothetical protein
MRRAEATAEPIHTKPTAPADGAANDASGPGSNDDGGLTKARTLLDALQAALPEMIRLTDEQRAASSGRLAQRYETTLRPLFGVTAKPRYRPAFSLLVMNDGTGAKVPYDPERAQAHLERAAGMRAMAASFRAIAEVMDDDALHHGALAVDAGLAALKIARSTADNNPAFRAEVAHVLNDFKSMTAAARRAKAAGAEEPDAADEDAAEPAAKPDEK